MSISSVGATNSNQLLLSMLSQLDATNSATSSTSSGTSSSTSSTGISTSSSVNSLTGSGKGDLSSQILGLLMMMQNDPSATASSGTTSTTSTTPQNPLAKLVSAIDTDGDGSISQGEMESYIESKGGTQVQADKLFSSLNQGNTGNLTQTQLASDLQSAGGPQAHHGHHHHHGVPPSADDVASKLVQAMDTSGDGTVDQSEFENFVTSLGGTTSRADADFAALDTSNSGSVTANQFGSAITAFESASSPQSMTGTTSPILTLLDGLGSATTASA